MEESHYEPLEIPRNSPTGFVTAFFAVVIGFAMIWHIWWLAALGFLGAYATFVVFAWRDVAETEISAKEVARIDRANHAARSGALRKEDPQVTRDPDRIGHRNAEAEAHSDAPGNGAGGPASKRIIVGYGFWIFLLSDIIMFSGLFAAYAVLSGATADGPAARQLFDLNNVALQTGCLLLSSFACGMASLAVARRSQVWTQAALGVTGLLGLAFLLLELHEFAGLISRGDGPTRSAFLSAFFTLVGCHGLHITIGLLWLGTMMAQIFAKGFRQDIRHRFLCFSLFWHALDIIWVAIFSLVYLMGVIT